MGMKEYFKRLVKYVLYEHKQPIIYNQVSQHNINELLKDKVFLVTGGSKGIGYYIADILLKSGAEVIITGRKEETLKEKAQKLGEKCKYKVLDVTNISQCNTVLKDLYKEYNQIDGLVNNAGISLHEENILKVSEENFDLQFDTNLKGAYFLSKYYIELYKEYNQKSGNILFVSSERGSMCDDIPYGLTKVAINSLTEGLSRRLYKSGIRVNAIAPGVTATNMTKIDKMGDVYAEKASGRAFAPEEIADVALYILSDYSKCISGEVINCDAGNHINTYFDKL